MTSSDEDHANTEVEQSRQENPSQPIWQLLFFLLMWQSLFRVSNAALSVLLKFLALFVRLFGNAFVPHSEQLHELTASIPRDVSGARRFLWKTNEDDFITYVVCPKCDSVYHYQDCFVSCGRRKESKCCRHIAYPNHPHARRRQECGALLLKKVRFGRNYRLVPIKEYAYQPLSRSFAYLARREEFLNACERWRDRMKSIPQGHLGDVYDGRVWQEFASDSTQQFLDTPYCYLLTLNVDWFQPFTHTQYSVGAMYLTVQNLPRSERYKEENVILVGIIPGPSEPSLTINSYLAPLVQELQQAWNTGIAVRTPNNSVITIRLALTCVTCDIPASRKVCGFLGHNATLGCNKCYKEFVCAEGGGTDYSGYDRETWHLRNCQSHREHCREILNECTKTGIKQMESKYGVRYSILLSLPYFDPVRYTAIDIMHNLFLGTGKHMFKVWLKEGILSMAGLEELDRRANTFQVPHSTGRLPVNIASNYGGFKAAQWQVWITVYSPVILKGLIPDNHLRCWLLFVRACTILSQRIVRKDDVVTADLLLLNFCRQFEQLYGSEHCTPNLHLHLHLKDCLLDHGPSHAFWCFSFERYNGLLGSFHTNRKSIEQQIMRKFVSTQRLRSEAFLANVELMSLLPSTLPPTCTSVMNVDTLTILNMSSSPLTTIQSFGSSGNATVLPPVREDIFNSEMLKDLELLYGQLYPSTDMYISPFFVCSGRATLCGQVVGSVMNATSCNSSSVITAYWPSRGNDLSNIDYFRPSVGRVQYFVKHQVKFGDSYNGTEHIFAYVSWKQKHPHQDWYGISATVCLNMNEPPSICSFIPIQRIRSVCAYSLLDTDIAGLKECVFVAVPVSLKMSL